MSNKTTTTLNLRTDLRDKVKELAKEEVISMSYFVDRAIIYYLENNYVGS